MSLSQLLDPSKKEYQSDSFTSWENRLQALISKINFFMQRNKINVLKCSGLLQNSLRQFWWHMINTTKGRVWSVVCSSYQYPCRQYSKTSRDGKHFLKNHCAGSNMLEGSDLQYMGSVILTDLCPVNFQEILAHRWGNRNSCVMALCL